MITFVSPFLWTPDVVVDLFTQNCVKPPRVILKPTAHFGRPLKAGLKMTLGNQASPKPDHATMLK